MSHEVESMFSVKETPWHGLGKIVAEAPSTEEAIRMAGLDWEVVSQPVIKQVEEGLFQQVPTHQILSRSDNGSVLSVMSNSYHPLQNKDAFKFFDPFVQSKAAKFETAGSLREGKVVWILANINSKPISVGKGDEVAKFLLLSNAHDGSMAVRVAFTPVRVVCANTLAMAHNNRSSAGMMRIHHTKNVKENLEVVQDMVNLAEKEFQATAEQYKYLTKKAVSQKDLEKYVKIIFPVSASNDERRKLAEQRNIESIQKLFETGYGADLKTARGTYWGLYNAVTQYLSYDRGNKEDSRLNSLWFGDAQTINKRALDLAVEEAL